MIVYICAVSDISNKKQIRGECRRKEREMNADAVAAMAVILGVTGFLIFVIASMGAYDPEEKEERIDYFGDDEDGESFDI